MPGKTEHLLYRVIVVADLWHYRDIAKDLDKQVGGRGVFLVNGQIQSFIDAALHMARIEPKTIPSKFTGDGKILAFETAEAACRFAEALHNNADFHNITRPVLLHRRHFRIGICSGEIVLEEHTTGGEVTGHEFNGLAVADASRLEGVCVTGEILICPETYDRLPPPIKQTFGERIQITIKGGEVLEAYHRKVVNPVPDARQPENRVEDAIPHAKGAIGAAIRNGIAEVDAVVSQAAGDGTPLTLAKIQMIISEAISHGAGIYNDGSPGGCARIYLHTASCLVRRFPPTAPAASHWVAQGPSLATEWLARIVADNPAVAEISADDLAWELRFAFDSIQQISLLDQITQAVTEARTLLGKPNLKEIAGIVRQAVSIGAQIRRDAPHVGAYLLRHTAVVVLRVFENNYHPAPPPAVTAWIKNISPVVTAHPRITRHNAMVLAEELPELLQAL